MKKVLSIILALLLITSTIAIVATTTTANGDPEVVTVTIETKRGPIATGTSFELSVNMSKVNFGYASIAITNVQYNTDALQFDGFNKKACTFEGLTECGPKKLSFVTTDGGDEYPENKGGNICNLKFTTISDIDEADVTFNITVSTYDNARIIENSNKEVSIVKGGVALEIPPEVKFEKWEQQDVTMVGDVNAVLGQSISIKNGLPTYVGMELYSLTDTLLAQGSKDLTGEKSSTEIVLYITFDINKDLKYSLFPANGYKYRYYVEIEGAKYYSDMQTLYTTGSTVTMGDVDNDGNITAADALQVLQYAVKKITQFTKVN